MARPKVLLTVGSPHQVKQMHRISEHLGDCDCSFSQVFTDHRAASIVQRLGLLDESTVGEGSVWRREADRYLSEHGLQNDFKGRRFGNAYELVVLCADYLVPRLARQTKTIFVQEGMTDLLSPWSRAIHALRLPGFLSMDTSLIGASNVPDVYCVGSEGYADHFAALGAERRKMFVTGVVNYDDLQRYLHNDFPHRGHVLVATSDRRETALAFLRHRYGREDRHRFIERAIQIAGGRPLIFKLHPHEDYARAEREIREVAPASSLIFRDGPIESMIANCEELVCEFSGVVFFGLALGKKVHSYHDPADLKRKLPIQNGAQSAKRIAEIIRAYLAWRGSAGEFCETYRPSWSD